MKILPLAPLAWCGRPPPSPPALRSPHWCCRMPMSSLTNRGRRHHLGHPLGHTRSRPSSTNSVTRTLSPPFLHLAGTHTAPPPPPSRLAGGSATLGRLGEILWRRLLLPATGRPGQSMSTTCLRDFLFLISFAGRLGLVLPWMCSQRISVISDSHAKTLPSVGRTTLLCLCGLPPSPLYSATSAARPDNGLQSLRRPLCETLHCIRIQNHILHNQVINRPSSLKLLAEMSHYCRHIPRLLA
jgi:hypothetical protein